VTAGGGLGAHAFLLRELARRDFHGRYAGSLLGFAWSFVQPLWQLLLYSYVFSLVLRIPVSGGGSDRFWVFLFAGLLPWLAVQEGVLRGATAITDNANLVKKHRLRAEVLVLSIVLAALLHEGIAAALFVLVLGVLGELAPAALPWLLLALSIQLALTCGLALLMAAVHVFVRDTAQILSMVLGAWFYLTPIVYSLALVPDRLRWVADANPLTAVVGLYRTGLYGAEAPSAAAVAASGAVALVLLALGAVVFRRLAPEFGDAL
jgi:lipopolysaccharide transport system permease protein